MGCCYENCYQRAQLGPLTQAVPNAKNLRQKKFRPTEDARHVFTDAYESVRSFAFTVDEKAAADHYAALMSQTWLVCAKDEAVCKVLACLTFSRVSPSVVTVKKG